MKKGLSVIILLLISTAACADTTNIAPHAFAHSGGDLSMTYLAQIFGTVGGTLHGTSGQMMGKVFDIFNKGVLVAAAIYLIYTIFSVMMRSAHDGSFMGHNKYVAFLFLRIGFAFALAIPLPTGYSTLQTVLMKVVVQGVGLADNVWSTALNYMEQGGAIYVPPKENKISTKEAQNILQRSQSIFVNEVCMIESTHYRSALNKQMQQSNNGGNNTSPYVSYAGSQSYGSYNLYLNSKTNTIFFPGLSNKINYSPSNNVDSACGQVVGVGGPLVENEGLNNQTTETYSWLAMHQMVMTLMPAAQRYVCMQHPGWSSCNNFMVDKKQINTQNEETFLGSLLDYVNMIQPYAHIKQNGVKKSKFVGNTKRQGWASAGMYYWNIIALNDAYQAVSVANSSPQVYGYISSKINQNSGLQQDVKQANSSAKNYKSVVINSLLNQYTNNQGAAGGNLGGGAIGGSGVGGELLRGFLSNISAGVEPILVQFKKVAINPIVFLSQLGQDCVKASIGIWVAGLAIILPLSLMAGICTSEQPLGLAFKAGLDWIKPVMLFLAGVLFVPGILLGYYVPLFPFIVFTFAVIGWLISVVEAMLAAPLVCFGMTHPEGHDFLGKAEQALMLILLVFLRPVLLIIGLIVWMLISYVGFKILIYGFEMVINNIFLGGNGSGVSNLLHESYSVGGALGIMILGPVLLTLIAMVSYSFVKHTAPVITDISTMLAKWIGWRDDSVLRPVQAASEGQRDIESAAGTMRGAGGKLGEATVDGAGSFGAAAGKQAQGAAGGLSDQNKLPD